MLYVADRHYKIINESSDDSNNDEIKYFDIYKEVMDMFKYGR